MSVQYTYTSQHWVFCCQDRYYRQYFICHMSLPVFSRLVVSALTVSSLVSANVRVLLDCTVPIDRVCHMNFGIEFH